MVGRGTRIDLPTNKLMFRVYDYTNATRLFGDEFIAPPPREGKPGTPLPPPTIIQVDGFDVHVAPTGRFVMADVNGKAMPVPLDEYKQKLGERLLKEIATLKAFRYRWIEPTGRLELLDALVSAGYSPKMVRIVDRREEYDLYDVLAELAWGMSPRTRPERAYAFQFKNEAWLNTLPVPTGNTIKAIARQFAVGGTEGLESPQILRTPEVVNAGGLDALREIGDPAVVLRVTKMRMFAA